MRRKQYTDFDEFAASVQGVESKMLLRNPKDRVWTTSHINLGDVEVQFGRLGSGNIAQGELRSDGFMVYLPLSKDTEYVANGQLVPKYSAVVLEPGCEFCISTKTEHDWCVAFVKNELLGFSDPIKQFGKCRVTQPDPPAANMLRYTLRQIETAAIANDQFESSAASSVSSEEVQKLVRHLIQIPEPTENMVTGRPRVSRDDIIESTMALLDHQPGSSVNIRELSKAASVSERTLRSIFNEYFGVGPIQYLQLRQLHHIHRALKQADPDCSSVSQILANHGEWAFGRFASRYKAVFGELPSETIRRNG